MARVALGATVGGELATVVIARRTIELAKPGERNLTFGSRLTESNGIADWPPPDNLGSGRKPRGTMLADVNANPGGIKSSERTTG